MGRRLSLTSFSAGAMLATVLAVVPATAVVRASGGAPAAGGVDTTAPSLTVFPTRFVLGASIDAAGPVTGWCDQQPLPWNFRVPLRMSWRGSDAGSGIAGYDVWAFGPGYEGDAELVHGTLATSYGFSGGNYDGSNCGGGNPFDDTYYVVARDNRGNSAATARDTASAWVYVWQEDASAPDQRTAPELTVARTGTWRVSGCSCSNGGSTLFSSARGAALKYTVTTTRPGQTVAVVVGKNTNRGKAAISVDGRRATTVNTYASTPTHRVIVWQKTLRAGTHTVKVTNLGTSGHSRVDVDSVLLTK